MLLHHADAAGYGVRGTLQMQLLALEVYGTACGLFHAVQDLHQRCLASAVLADDGQDLAFMQRDAHVVVGHELVVAFDYVLHRQHRSVVNVQHPRCSPWIKAAAYPVI